MFIVLGYLAVPIFLITHLNGLFWVGVLMNIPMIVDGVTQYKRWRTSNNLLRAVTGLLSGVGQSMVVASFTFLLTATLLRWM